MTLNDLIETLTRLRDSEGDVPVFVDNDAADDAGADWSTGQFVILSALVN